MTEHYQCVEPQIGGFPDQFAGVAALGGISCGEDCLHGLLAHLLEDPVEPGLVQAGNVGRFGIGFLALLENDRKALNHVTHARISPRDL